MPLYEVEVFIEPTTLLIEADNEIDAAHEAELMVLNKGFEVDFAEVTEFSDAPAEELADVD